MRSLKLREVDKSQPGVKRLDRARAVVVLGALMALMLGAAPRARAGQWQIKHLWRYNWGVSSPQWSGSFSSDTYYPDGLSDEYSFEGKGAHAPAPGVDNGTESPRVYSPASSHATMNCRAVLTWQPNGSLESDPVPDKVYICEYASAAALAEEIAEQRADGSWPSTADGSWPSTEGGGVPGFGYTLNNGFGDETKYRPNPYGDFRDCGGPNYEWRQMTAEGGHVRAVATNGDAQIEIARSLSVSVSIGNQTKAAVGGVIGYRVELINFLLSASVQKGAPLGIKPDFQEWNGYLKQDYRLNAPGEPLVPFWSAAGTYSVVATREQGGPIFDPQRYQWSVQGAGTPYIPEPHDAVEGEHFLPDDDAGTAWQKEFHFAFSAAQAGVPQTTTVRVAVTGEDAGSEALTAKAVVHWNLPRWFVTKP